MAFRSLSNRGRTFAAMAALFLFFASGSGVASRTDENINYDDPNLAMTNSFVGDSVSSCPSDLKAAELTKCLREKGLTSNQDVAHVPITNNPANH